MNKLTAIKIKYDDGTYSDEIPVSVLSENVEWDSTHTLVDVLGSIDVDVTGTIQDQISQLFNEKVSTSALQSYVASQLKTDVSEWLNNNVNPVGSTVIVDESLSISSAAADAKITGDVIESLQYQNEFTHIEDIASAGSYKYVFEKVIPKNSEIIITNTGTATFSINLQDKDGTETKYGNLSPNQDLTIIAQKNLYAIRSYVNGNSWSFKISYGGILNNLKDSVNDLKDSIKDLSTLNTVIDLNKLSKNIFLFDNSFKTQQIGNLSITKLSDNSFKLNGTVDTDFDLHMSFKGFSISAGKYYHRIVSNDNNINVSWRPGYFDTDGVPHQGNLITTLDEDIVYTYGENASSSRHYFSFTAGTTYDNVILTFFVFVNKPITDEIDNIDNKVNNIDSKVNNITGVEYKHEVTVAPSTETNYFYFPSLIQTNTDIIIYNTGNSTFTINLIKEDNTERTISRALSPNASIAYTTQENIIGFRSYVNGNEWKFLVKIPGYYDLDNVIEKLDNVIEKIEQIDYPSDSNKNYFVHNQKSLLQNGVEIDVINNHQIKLNGTSTSRFNLNFAFKTFNVSGTTYLLLDCDPSFEDKDLYLTPGYFDENDTARQLAALQTNVITKINFPILEGNNSRFYFHIGNNLTFNNSVFTFKSLKTDPTYNSRIETIINEVKNNINNSFNSEYHSGLTNAETYAKNFSYLMTGDSINNIPAVQSCEAFLFFTDPHTQIGSYSTHFEEYLAQIEKIYNITPTSFVLCGGDWLGNSDTPEIACYKMGLIKASCQSLLQPCYLLVGNHDTNYQGKKDSESAVYTTRFPNESIQNLWYNGEKAYFTFKGRKTNFYCFDTGIENQSLDSFNNYGYEQGQWFAQKLLTDNNEHIAVAMHIYYASGISTDNPAWNPIGHLIMQIAAAYNKRTSITINGETYNFNNSSGLVEFAIAGHTHEDLLYRFTEYNADIPVIITVDTGYHSTYPTDASFDLVFVDYDNRIIKTIRVGSGENREINLASLN